MVSINDPDFVENFELERMTVGLVGYGYVGHAIEAFFHDDCFTRVYDKFQDGLDTLEDVVRESHVIFSCVPTPMEKDGSCHTGIVESVLDDIKAVAKSIDRDTNEFIVVIKSTVWPGFTQKMQERGGLRVMFSPEFLTEKNSIEDFEHINRVVLGGDMEDAVIVAKLFERKLTRNEGAIVQASPLEAELCKLFTNSFLTTKVIFANEFYQLCEKLGANYDEVKLLACLDYKRIANSHLNVPGHDGQFGYGGHCFPKDIASLRAVCKGLGIGERMFSAVIERNDELRERKDWLEMKGRAVVEDYGQETGNDSDGPGRDPVLTGEDGDLPSGGAKA